MNKIIDIIKQSSKIAILTHISEDADALCSAEALLEGLKSLNKNVQIFQWNKIKNNWDDEIFPNIKFEVNVDIALSSKGSFEQTILEVKDEE